MVTVVYCSRIVTVEWEIVHGIGSILFNDSDCGVGNCPW